MMDYPQPREGVVGALRDQDDLLSLEDKALPRRQMMAALGYSLYRATLVGNPAPIVAQMFNRISHPQVGDLVLETSTFYIRPNEVGSLGILLEHRNEWAHTDQEWAEQMADEDSIWTQEDNRPIDEAWYVQYGPQPDDIYRWHNAMFIMVPTDRAFGSSRWGTRIDSGEVTLNRNQLIDGLADSGFQLRQPGAEG